MLIDALFASKEAELVARMSPDDVAQREGVRARLTRTGMQPETAHWWLDTWVLEGSSRGLPRDGAIGKPAGAGSLPSGPSDMVVDAATLAQRIG